MGELWINPPEKIIEKADSGKHLPRGTETVLLVEDEEAIRSLASEVLRTSGYTVLEASRPEEALEICRQYDRPINLMVTDLTMPTMGGRELAEVVLGIRPEVRILYMSGYTDDPVIREKIGQSKVAFLKKPFSLSALAKKVREVLDQGKD